MFYPPVVNTFGDWIATTHLKDASWYAWWGFWISGGEGEPSIASPWSEFEGTSQDF